MPELLKDSFGPEVPVLIGEMIARVYPDFDKEAFLALARDGYENLELTPRARHIASALASTLPLDRERAIQILIESLGPEIGDDGLTGMHSFIYMPHTYFVAEHGLDCFETSMGAQYELTKRFTAEFSIRAFIERHPERTLDRLRRWTADPNVHVRRLVSEGTRPRLPWAARLRKFQADPTRVIELLELLKDDPEEYVRRSVANNLNDISKDNPDVVVTTARRWSAGANSDRKRLVRHALRTLVKQGNAGALEVLGYSIDSPAVVGRATCVPRRVEIGGKVRLEVRIDNPSDDETRVLVDFRVHFVKANGSTSSKVFKGKEMTIFPRGRAAVGKTISVAQHSTRKHYLGVHRVEVLLNGRTHPGAEFEVV